MANDKMKRFVIVQVIIAIISILLCAFGYFLFLINNEVIHKIGSILLLAGAIHILILMAYAFGGWDMEEDYKKHLSSIEEGHIVVHNHDEKQIAKQNEEIKKLKKRIQRLSRRKRKKYGKK